MIAAFLLACSSESDTGPARDADGCWTDGREAFDAIVALECAGPWSECAGRQDSCAEHYEPFAELETSNLCFDGCKVDACLDALREANESCEGSDYLTLCFDGALSQHWGGTYCELAW